MKRSMKIGWAAMTLLIICSFTGPDAYADTITGNQVAVKENDVITAYNLDDVKWETEDGKTKVCICRCLSFRSLQTLASQFADGVIPKEDITIYSGWTTDGPEELFIEVMGWPDDDLEFMTDPTAPAYLTIEDAYFFFIQKSTGKVWKVVAKEDLYPMEFFTYRTLVKTGAATQEQKAFFRKSLRPQAAANMETLPFIDKFDIQAVPFYGEDGILHIPALFVFEGREYEADLEEAGKDTFELTDAVQLH
nr:hypothetical protein [Deltaproteobacteria bacterium]